MGRLIDAEEFKKQIAGIAITNNYSPEKANALCELIDKQPTAYDKDKVVTQLERDSYEETADDMNAFEPPQVVNLYNAIEIVRGGGVDG